MMVIQGTSVAGNAIAAVKIHPADRCIWTQTNSDGTNGYAITLAFFEPGNEDAIPISDPQLGFIGKSGRFVQIAR